MLQKIVQLNKSTKYDFNMNLFKTESSHTFVQFETVTINDTYNHHEHFESKFTFCPFLLAYYNLTSLTLLMK